ncbi:dTDP-4-dehydrorhamnose 3,5-epimerase [Oceaniovalibus guishaninsula JLT2003]|uniref:dTDP-4-dehydrorhamnose 3,5-epimerase n=1 Tax=Oceaniovalibus guishaninsula JLT2003 TaxID=1231392 RepID=K2I6A4_9RHOB|nr:dTDP-4-dehydrorhamnose 3,5-epimerase [Oceaniovalibus guishaninsula]EKE44515.1 dTDP-4-dehydrorhamnose 3,5-epimerase [Oceaniovalibus guishaninsula JLT2003]
MQIEQTALDGVLILTPRRHGDARGWFAESWNRATLAEHGITTDWVQDNHSFSARAGTVRGLHYQSPPAAQAKLVRCARGALTDVAVDFRSGSATFGRWVAVDLTEEDGRQLLIPQGFLHGFVTRKDATEIAYKCSAPYSPRHDGAVRWDDPAIGIDWRIDPADAILSAKDAAAPLLNEVESPFVTADA